MLPPSAIIQKGGFSMTEHEKYQEHIRHTHDAFCKTVIRHAAIDAARSIRSRRKREISLEYLIEEKHYHSGWDVGRLGAQGLCNICTPVSPEQAKPGDLVFFVGTYDTPGVSHVGIYVGNSVMLHCGDPISYTNLNSSYWQQHFYCYGRLP